MEPLYAASLKKKKSQHSSFQAQSFLVSSVWKQGGYHFVCIVTKSALLCCQAHCAASIWHQSTVSCCYAACTVW